MKKILAVFIFALFIPTVSYAGFFDNLHLTFKSLGAQTKSALTSETRVESFKKGDKDPEVLYIQNLLAGKKFYDGSISGLIGPKTEAAIMSWQKQAGLKVTGLLDKETIESIAGLKRGEGNRGGSTQVSIKTFLGGPYNPATGLMSTGLNDSNLIPLEEPYSALGYGFQGGGGEETTQEVLDVSGPNAIVDWVVVEFRSPSSMMQIEQSRAALLQSDGDIVDVDGVSPLPMQLNGNLYVAVLHRNHLPIVTASPIAISQPVNMTTAALFGVNPAKTVNGLHLLWPGDAYRDDQYEIKYTGENNDKDFVLQAVGGTNPNNIVSNVYSSADVNMDGKIKYTGTNNDRDPILQTVGGATPNNVVQAQLPELNLPFMFELISSSSVVSTEAGFSDMGTFTITFKVSPIGHDIVIPSTVQLADGSHTNGEGLEYGIKASGTQQTTAPSAVIYDDTDSDMLSGGGYLVQEGESETFTLTTIFSPLQDGFFKTYLNSVNYGVYTNGTWVADHFYNLDLGSNSYFSTDYLFLNAI